MEKEEIPKPKIEYRYVGKKENPKDSLKKSLPKEIIPTSKTGFIFGLIFLLVIIFGLLKFPLGSFLSGNTDVSFSVGYPWTFLSFELENPEKLPIRIGGLLLDLALYIFISYALDVAINVFLGGSIFKRKKKEGATPHQYNLQSNKKTLAEKAAEKTAKNKVEKLNQTKQSL